MDPKSYIIYPCPCLTHFFDNSLSSLMLLRLGIKSSNHLFRAPTASNLYRNPCNMSTSDTNKRESVMPEGSTTNDESTNKTSPNGPQRNVDPSSSKRPNAFTELMSAWKKPKSNTAIAAEDAPSRSKSRPFDYKDGLGIYIQHPEKNPEGRVVEYDDDWVVINDKFPKASVHLLLLPRDPSIAKQHPLTYLSTHPEFLSKLRTRAAQVARLAASELRRQYGRDSASDAPYQSALESLISSPEPPTLATPDDASAAQLPQGRDWMADILVGVHTHPSMSHMHVHVLSREAVSPWMKHKKHYLSFHSRFWVGLDEFPLNEGGQANLKLGDWPSWDMLCWRCGENFGNRFAKLKRHLDDEFEVWKKE
ncbi:unnamed protein product [Periconia digitata]|uniref:Aprataxin n=1 Tax=Periconia digitata TaxID=1303443 RepID=A0A9W4UTI9_9PLEO|nr:unnamed protein product [Periconia digitata]